MMIVDHLNQMHRYANLHPLFAKAFDYISTTDLASLEIGKFDIDGENLRGIVSDKIGRAHV